MASATLPAQTAAPTRAAAAIGKPPRMATDMPAPARRKPDGDMIARATFAVFTRSGNRSIAMQTPLLRVMSCTCTAQCAQNRRWPSKITYDVGEDILDG